MVGIVLVSHSHELAQAGRALAAQQTQGRAAIAAVGGTGDPDFPFGTDALAILEAIQSVYHDDGVLVLMDLGSAILSAETALEFMAPDQAARVRLSAGPFIEGAMAAAVQASIGMGLEAVAREAAEAMGPKREALEEQGLEVREQRPEAGEPALRPVLSLSKGLSKGEAVETVTLVNHAGLHFGPAVLFVQKAAAFPTEISVRNLTTGAGPADAKRFNQVLSLGAEQGHTIELRARGPEAQVALAALVALAAAGFGEEAGPEACPEPVEGACPEPVEGPVEGACPELVEGAETSPITAAPAPSETTAAIGSGQTVLRGLPAADGWAVGRAFILAAASPQAITLAAASPQAITLAAASPQATHTTATNPAAEWLRYQAAADQAKSELATLAERMEREVGATQARIFQAHALAIGDPDLADAIRSAIHDQALDAEAAVLDATEAAARRYEAMEGVRFQERAVDLRDVGARLLRLLRGEEEAALDLPAETILLAEDLTPSQTATLDRSKILALCTVLGGPTAHTAILARSLGLPAVVGVGSALLDQVQEGDMLAIDGATGVVIIEPDADTQTLYRSRQAEWVARRQAAQANAQASAHTRDGKRVEVVANLALAAEASAALAAGAEGVGLLRTEFLFQERITPPTEDEQTAAYAQVAAAMAPRPVVIRTLDIGGDKPAPYLNLPVEANPFLGWRAIRISLALPDFFKTQLRAILRAAVHGNVHVMFPMIATPTEVAQAQALLAEAAAELAAADIPHRYPIPTGIMIEVPAAVTLADQLASRVDFFSIGTNDLTQYTFAVDRGNARVAALADPLHPAILRQIANVIDAAHAAGKWVGLCGELAGRSEAIPILLGLGLDEFSMSAPAIPAAKSLLARLTMPEVQVLARTVLDLPDGKAVRAATTLALAQ